MRATRRSGVVTVLCLALAAPSPIASQEPRGTVRLAVEHDAKPVEGALVRSDDAVAQTDRRGRATLQLPPGPRVLLVTRIGFVPETVAVTVRAGMDTLVAVALEEQAAVVEQMIVSATRTERRIEDVPLRVEVLAREEIEEKLLMTPGDISMMLNETSGLRVQTTSPSLGGANVRVQGLRGRYTQILSDGLPLYGGQTGSLGLLQIPPMDLGQVEVIKGAASALYGGSALGGIINIVSRRPANDRELLINGTTLGGADAVAYVSAPFDTAWGYTVLAGAHSQRRADVDDDGWADLPQYERVVARPRLFWSSGRGHSLFATGGATLETREGGTIGGNRTPAGEPFAEALRTTRVDAGSVGRWLAGTNLLSARASIALQQHRHRYGDVRENDRHLTWFGEGAWARTTERNVMVLGAALQQETYRARDVPGFDFTHTTPALFAQDDFTAAPWLTLSASARTDWHSEYGAVVSPRVSALVRGPSGWTARASAGSGFFAPTPFTEETEVIGLSRLRPPSGLRIERARTASADVGGVARGLELNVTLFASSISDPIALREVPGGSGDVELVNARGPTRTAGGELLARVRREPFGVTATYTHLRSTELDVETDVRRDVPLTPRHAVGVVGVWERHETGRAGFELYYTGRQPLDDNPYRTVSRPYVVLGFLVERRVGSARVFLNAENLLDARQTRYDPLLLPARGRGGRWTTDAWAPLEGRVINAGVRLSFGGAEHERRGDAH